MKIETELRAANWAGGDSSSSTVIMRPASVFRERDFFNFWSIGTRAIPWRANAQIGDGTNLYVYTYVGQICRCPQPRD